MSDEDGVPDRYRFGYLSSRIAAVSDANAEGDDIRGDMVKSLFDNLEWALGCSNHLRIVYVTNVSLRRTPKHGVRLYHRIFEANASELSL